ncbi:MAG: stage II sporulation protein P [Oscillospiraceae bacterium]|nr:stage II sporulation protein P [Bacillota bacterium]
MENWNKRVRRTCVGVLLLALLLRLGGSGPMAAQDAENAAAFFLYLQTGRVAKPTGRTDQPAVTVPTETQPTTVFTFPTAPLEDGPLSFAASDLEGIEIKNGSTYEPDFGALLEAPVSLDFSGEEPRILIIHTHATESYTMEPGWEYTASSDYRTLDPEYNMIRVGEAITRVLEEAGIPVLHDTTLNDYPSYNGSYDRTRENIERYLEQYPSIQMVIDVHRDAVELMEGGQMATSATVNGKPAAQVMFVMGSDEGGLTHPDWQQNLSWALKLQVQMERQYPGLTRPLSLRPERYNEHATPGSVLLEVGTAGDTLQRAILAGEAFAHTLVSVIQGLDLR